MCLRRVIVSLVCFIICFSPILEASIGGYAVLTNGYRRDDLSSVVDFFTPRDASLLGIDHLKTNNISTYQLGLKGKWIFCDLLLYLEGAVGWSGSGRYHETLTLKRIESLMHAGIGHGSTTDFMAGTGYRFNLWGCLQVGPTVGWSYNYQRYSVKDIERNEKRDRRLDELKCSNRWQGPWIGLDAAFNTCLFDVEASYEYHWAHWNSNVRLGDDDRTQSSDENPVKANHRMEGFSDRRHSNHARGHVFYVDAFWKFCFGWNMGIGVKFQQWKATNGHERSEGEFFGIKFRQEKGKVKSAKWYSYAVTYNIGYVF